MAAAVAAPDSSVLVAGLVPVHPFHKQAVTALKSVRSGGRLVGHTMAEAYAVLTRQPYIHPAANVLLYLQQFTNRDSPVSLSPSQYPLVMQKLANADITGAAIYDGLIAAAVQESGLGLMSFDRRAARVYELFGIDYEILS